MGIWKSKDPPLIKAEINGGPPILNHVFYFDLPPSLECLGIMDEENKFCILTCEI